MNYAPTAPYRPLGWRTTAACVAIGGTIVAHLLSDVASFATLGASEEDLGAALAQLAGGVGLLGASILAAVIFLVWFHRAAVNVRAFGATGLQFTPGWCVGWWFVPLASLWKPLAAVKEVWRASEPDGVGQPYGWTYARTPGIMNLWWATYVVGNILGNLSGRIEDRQASAVLGVCCTVANAVCAACVIPIIRGLARRQEECGERLARAWQAPAAPPGYSGPPGYDARPGALDNPYAPPR